MGEYNTIAILNVGGHFLKVQVASRWLFHCKSFDAHHHHPLGSVLTVAHSKIYSRVTR
jgi:hypothetical protein